MRNKKKHTTTIVLRTLVIATMSLLYLTAMFLVVTVVFNFDIILKQKLTGLMHEASKQTYTFDYESIQIDFLNRKIAVSDIYIEPSKPDASQSQYAIYTPKLSVSHIKLVTLISQRRFVAALLDFDNPDVSLSSGEKVSLQDLENSKVMQGDTLFIPFFQEIFFDTLRINNASFQLDTLFNDSITHPKIYLEATHFKLGGQKFTNIPYPFDVSDLSIIVRNLQQPMPDSLHRISVDEIKLSLLNKNIKAQNVNLTPTKHTTTFENLYTISMPEIAIKTTMIDKLLQSDTINLETFHIKNPSIKIKFGSKIQQGTPLNEINLHKLIENKIQWVNIKHFSVENAQVELIPSDSKLVAQYAENLTINFYDFRADSTSYRDKNRILSAKSLDASMQQFTLNHLDQIHQLVIEDLQANSANNIISSGKIHFNPLPHINTETASTLIETTASSVEFSGVDFHAFYHEKIVPMKNLVINNPESTVGIQQQLINKETPKDKSIILEKTSDYLKGIYVDEASILNGKLQYSYLTHDKKEGFFSTHYAFNLSDLSVDSATFFQSDKIFFAENFDVNFSDAELQLADGKHFMTIDNLNMSSVGKQAEMHNLKIKPTEEYHTDEQTEYFDIEFPRIQLRGANLHRAFFEKELIIAELSIYNPVFNVEKYGKWTSENQTGETDFDYHNEIYKLISDYLYKIKINQLNMHNGLLNLNQYQSHQANFHLSNKFSVKLSNFEIDAFAGQRTHTLFFSENIDLILKDQTFNLTDGVHKILAREIGILSSENRFYIKDANLYPDILSKKFENMRISYFANIPLLNITNTDIFSFFNRGELNVDEVILTEPSIRLMINPEVETKANTNQDHIVFFEDIKLLNTNKIIIKNGNLELVNYINHKNIPYANARVNFEMEKLQLTNIDNNLDYWYDDFSIALNSVNFDLDDDLHMLKAENLNYALSTKTIGLENLQLLPTRPIAESERIQHFELQIPTLSISNFDFNHYLENQTIATNQININSPRLIINDKRIEKQSTRSPYNLDLYSAISPIANSVSANSVSVNNASVSTKGRNQMQLNDINIHSNNFLIDEHVHDEQRFLNSEETSISVNNYETTISNGHFIFKTDKIEVNTDGRFAITGASLSPTLTRGEYARIKKYEADYFEINNANMSGTNFDVQKFIENGDLIIEDIFTEFDSVKIHRNKTYPLNPTQRPPMPQQAIRDLKRNLKIKNAQIKANYFEYTELESGAADTSYVYFTGLNAGVKNINNINTAEEPFMISEIEAYLMGEGLTNIRSEWNLHSFNNEFTMNAICHEMPLALLNPITEPSLNLSVREGINRRLEASFKANNDSSVGTMKFTYNDLRVSILNQKDGEVKEEKFLSFLINTLALKSDNPRRGRILIPSRFTHHRDKQRSIVGYCWRSIYAGIQVSLGMKDKEKQPEEDEQRTN